MARAIKPMSGDKQIKAADAMVRSKERLKASPMFAMKISSDSCEERDDLQKGRALDVSIKGVASEDRSKQVAVPNCPA
jgi:hypothetical protein